jgi:RNA-binding protein Nova
MHDTQQPPPHSPGDRACGATQMTMQVPDAVVPIILGKGGAIMREIQQRSGARIRVSQKGEYVPGTTDRIVTITAPSHHEAHGAYLMVAQKIGIT